MLIYVSNEGRLANKLWMAVKLLVVHLECKKTVLYPAFDEYRHCFDTTEKHGFILNNNGRTTGFRYLSMMIQLLCRFYRHTRSYGENASRLIFIDSMCHDESKHVEIANGWLKLSDGRLLAKYKKEIQSFFRPCDEYWFMSKTVIDSARKGSDVVIGVHVRRSDYAMWENGIYYYDDAHYRHYMGQASALFPDSKISFVLCSDEPISLDTFKEHDVIEASNHFVEDLYTLSMCDYIMGPPSTYSAWASFYGEVPLYRIGKGRTPIANSDFSVIGG